LEQGVLICCWRSETRQVSGRQAPPSVGGKEGVTSIDFRSGRVLGRGSRPVLALGGDRGEGSQQALNCGKRAYGLAEDGTKADRPAIGQEEYLRALECWDCSNGRRLWRYPVLGRPAYPSVALP
jgi:hypothetical protein